MNAALIAELKQLPPEERLRLIDELWETLAANPDQLPIPPAHARALAEDQIHYEVDPAAGSTWAEAKRRIIGKE